MHMGTITDRLATPKDADFLRSLFFVIRAPEFESAGLAGPKLEALLNQQYHAMRNYYDQEYAEAEYVIIEAEGQPIGYEATVDIGSLHVLDIALMPEFRSRGIGTDRMRALQERAAKMGKSLTLTVEVFNPALRLYERLGFAVTDEAQVYLRMRWSSAPER